MDRIRILRAGVVEHHVMAEAMKEMQQQRIADEIPDTLILVEHPEVVTVGPKAIREGVVVDGYPTVRTDRGGGITWHGPGQLVGYPILDLQNYGKDLHAYLRLLEESLVATLADFSIVARRREGLTGVWVEDRKIASIGVGIRRWVTMHGFALNISPDSLPPFLSITPCGIDGVTTTCLHHESGQHPDTQEVGKATLHHLSTKLAELAENSTT